jgi:hypothetical protein
MFIPNRIAYLRRKSKNTDMYGQYTYGQKEAVHYGLVRYNTLMEDSTVRADSSATRGNIKEFHSTGRVLIAKKFNPSFGDLIVVENKVFEIKGVEPRFNILGLLDHWQCELEKYEDLYGDEK